MHSRHSFATLCGMLSLFQMQRHGESLSFFTKIMQDLKLKRSHINFIATLVIPKNMTFLFCNRQKNNNKKLNFW
jgi:hypothetical protein